MSSAEKARSRKTSKYLENKSDNLQSVVGENLVVSSNKKKTKKHKVKLSMSKAEEMRLDQMIANDDGILVSIIVIILSLCFLAGIFLGCVLYRIALNGGL